MKELKDFNYEEAKEIRKALSLAIDKMREENEIIKNEDRFYLLDNLYELFLAREEELEEE